MEHHVISGRIDQIEMEEILTIIYELNGSSKSVARQCAYELFRKLDKNLTGEIDEEDFVFGCSQDPDIIYTIETS